MSELVTGEAVALELRPAKLPSRALAVLLDLIVAFICYIAVTMALVISTASLDEAAQMAISIGVFVLVLVGGPIAVETLSHGRSLGKLAFGLRVVRDDGGPIRFRHALVRGAVGVVEILMMLGVIACIASLVSARGRRLGDVFAGTLVVRERVPTGRAPFMPPPPHWLAGRFSELDLSAVPDGLWLAVRQYLTRMQQLDPQVGRAMAERLASDLVAVTGSPAPPGVPAAAYLAAVVQERQVREAQRAFGGGAAVGMGSFGPVPGPPAGVPAWGGPGGVPSGQGPAYTPPAGPHGAPPRPAAQPPTHPVAGGSPAPLPISLPQSPAQVPQSPPRPAQPSPSQDSATGQSDRPATGFAPPA